MFTITVTVTVLDKVPISRLGATVNQNIHMMQGVMYYGGDISPMLVFCNMKAWCRYIANFLKLIVSNGH